MSVRTHTGDFYFSTNTSTIIELAQMIKVQHFALENASQFIIGVSRAINCPCGK